MRKLPEGQKLLTVGRRFATESTKTQEHASKEEQAAAFSKTKDKMLQVEGVDKAICWGHGVQFIAA